MVKKKAEEMIIDTTPRRIQDFDREITYDMPCDGKLSSFVEYFISLIEKYGDDSSITFESADYYERPVTMIHVLRDETEAEVQRRIQREKKNKEKALVQRIRAKEKAEEKKKKEEKEELELFAKLQKKYKGYDIQEVNRGG